MSATSPFFPRVRLAADWHILSPRLEPVARTTPDPSVTVTQRKIWPWSPTIPVMIRNEYDDLLGAILSSLQRQQTCRGLQTEGDSTSLTSVRMHNLSEPLPSAANTVPGSLSVLDLGKTSFLALMFHLRVAADLPTLHMATKDSARIYKNGRLGELRNPTDVDLTRNMPPGTWCLVDSNPNLPDVPGAILESQMFIVQATSPRGDSMAHAKKRRSQICLMQPWSLEELIIGSSLQESRTAEAEIKFFFERFGGSARDVFLHAGDPDAFERDVDAAASELGADEIESLI
ncbi:hypothetical protein B0H12DRAFT_1072766 [Mycena haematopus]|nr:hypothetical protein B0H12DRAFT_1072766 [Mycena haematopus]